MKRLFTISLLVVYINSHTEFHEVLRLPLLIQHYKEHQLLVEDLSVWEFLVMHYQTDVAHDDQDNHLPFKDKAHSFSAPALTLPLQKIVLRGTTPLTQVHHSSKYKEVFIALHLADIFQPPRNS